MALYLDSVMVVNLVAEKAARKETNWAFEWVATTALQKVEN